MPGEIELKRKQSQPQIERQTLHDRFEYRQFHATMSLSIGVFLELMSIYLTSSLGFLFPQLYYFYHCSTLVFFLS